MPKTKKEPIPDNQLTLSEIRSYKVVKSNDLIQKSRFQLTVQEQKIILYLISKIRPDDEKFTTTEFSISEFCKVCGIGYDAGKNHKDIRDSIQSLIDKSIWVTLDDDKETILRWIDKPLIDKKAGTMQIKFDDLLKPYLLQLHNNFTQFELLYTLAMKSQYSIRLYEILRSYEYKHAAEFEIEDLKERLCAKCYERYPDFRRNVLDIAIREIEALSDISVTYEIFKEGRRYSRLRFTIDIKKDLDQRFTTWKHIKDVIGE